MSGSGIFVGLGANLPSERYGSPQETLAASLGQMAAEGVRVVARSSWYKSAPVPPSDQPWYVNAVARLETDLGPAALLQLLHRVEAAFGRVRSVANAARIIDLDLLAYGDRVSPPGEIPVLPHPRMAERAFVVLPLQEIAPHWRHPALGTTIGALVAALPPDQGARRLA